MKDVITGIRVLGLKRSIELIILSTITYCYGLFYIIKTLGVKGIDQYKEKYEKQWIETWINVYTTPYLSNMSWRNKLRYVKATI